MHKPNVFEDNLYAYLNMSNLKGLIVQTSDQYLLDLATRSVKNTTVGMVTIGSFFEKLNSTYRYVIDFFFRGYDFSFDSDTVLFLVVYPIWHSIL